MKKIIFLLIVTMVALPLAAKGEQEASVGNDGVVVLELARFFGDPNDSLMDSTDLSKADSEAATVQILTNIFNKENEGKIRVEKLGGSEWGSYYDQLNTTFASKNPPDIAIMHQTNMPAYASRSLLLELGDYYEKAGIDVSDWTAPAVEAVSYKDGKYGVPFDLHGNLVHVNVDIFKKAGLVDKNGNPILPSSVEEFFEQAQTVKEKTGKLYWVEDATQYPISFRLFHTLMEQQGIPIINEDGSNNLKSKEAQKALQFMLDMFKKGYSNPELDYAAAQQLFMTGQAAIELNGTWVVDQYNRELTFEYKALNFPNLMGKKKVWANSHMWVIPKQADKDAHYMAALKFCKFMSDHGYDWAAGTGHIAPRESALKALADNNVPQRANYAETASNAATFPPVLNYSAVETIIKEEIEKTWLLDSKVNDVLNTAAKRVDEVMNN